MIGQFSINLRLSRLGHLHFRQPVAAMNDTLFRPFNLGAIVLPNRIVMPP